MTTVGQRQQQEQLRKTTIQTTIQHVAHLPVVDVDATATCVHLNSGLATFLIARTTWKTNQGPMDHHNPQSRGTKQQQRPQPNDNHHHHPRFLFALHKIKTCPPCPSTTNNNKNKKNYKLTRTTSHSGPGPTTHHPQLRTKSVPWCSLSPFYQTVDNYLVIWVYIYYHKIIYKHVLLSRHRCSNSTGNHNSDNKNNNKRIHEKRKRVSIVSRVCVRHTW